MLSQRTIEILVGVFVVMAMIALTTLAFKISGLTNLFPQESYYIHASFDDIGGLKVRAPVKIGGVQIGQVAKIDLDLVTFKANVTMQILSHFNDIPDDSSAGIYTAGLLGDNYVAITPMYSKTFLTNNSHLEMTHSAMVLEKLIGQFLYRVNDQQNNGVKDHAAK